MKTLKDKLNKISKRDYEEEGELDYKDYEGIGFIKGVRYSEKITKQSVIKMYKLIHDMGDFSDYTRKKWFEIFGEFDEDEKKR